MAALDWGRARGGRWDQPRSPLAPRGVTFGHRRRRILGRTLLELGITFSVLLLILIVSLGLRCWLALPNGLMH